MVYIIKIESKIESTLKETRIRSIIQNKLVKYTNRTYS